MEKRVRVSKQSITDRTIEFRQKMLDFFKQEGGGTFGDMHKAIDPDADAQKLNYHFYALKSKGYLREIGQVKHKNSICPIKVWTARREKYEHTVSYTDEYIQEQMNNMEEIDEENELQDVNAPSNSTYVNGVCKVKMRHLKREPKKTGKVYVSGSTLYMVAP